MSIGGLYARFVVHAVLIRQAWDEVGRDGDDECIGEHTQVGDAFQDGIPEKKKNECEDKFILLLAAWLQYPHCTDDR